MSIDLKNHVKCNNKYCGFVYSARDQTNCPECSHSKFTVLTKEMQDKFRADMAEVEIETNMSKAIKTLTANKPKAAIPLLERLAPNGNYVLTATISQSFKAVTGFHASKQSAVELESLDMIAVKMARILSGGGGVAVHWQGIVDYAQLVVDDFKKQA